MGLTTPKSTFDSGEGSGLPRVDVSGRISRGEGEASETCVRLYRALREARPVEAAWRCLAREDDGAAWEYPAAGLRVIESVGEYWPRVAAPGKRREHWQHVSVSRAGRLPDYEDMKLVRRIFVGDDRECYAVYPPESRWVNDHPFVLHLWCSLDSPDGVLPDFRIGGTI